MTIYKKKYRVETTRLKNHAYDNGLYFVTICTKKKLQWFGKIVEGKIKLSELGKIVEQCIQDIPEHFPHVIVDDFCVMPDHVHIIISISSSVETRDARVSYNNKQLLHTSLTKNTNSVVRTNSLSPKDAEKKLEEENVSNEGSYLLKEKETRASRVSTTKPSLRVNSLGSIINQCKGTVTRKARQVGASDFLWQPRYHDHIIRSEKELVPIQKYIRCNPSTWDKETIPWHADATSFSL